MDYTRRNISWITAAAFLLAVEFLILIVWGFGFIPIETAPIAKGVVPQLLQLFKPEREITLYRLAIVAAIAIEVGLCIVFRRHIATKDLASSFSLWVTNASVWISLQLIAAFKLLQYQNPAWAKGLFYGAGICFVITQIFWPEIRKFMEKHAQPSWVKTNTQHIIVHVGMLIVIGVLLFIPGLNRTVSTQMIAAILYFWILYLLLVLWFDSVMFAVFGVVIAIKLNLFHLGQYPIYLMNLSSTGLANPWDLAVFFLIWQHIHRHKEWLLTLAGTLCAMAVVSHFASGLALTFAWLGYIVVHVVQSPSKKDVLLQLRAWGIVYVVVLCVVQWQWGVQGVVMQQWLMMKNGWDALPIISCLYMHQFFPFWLALLIPLVYVAIVVWGSTLLTVGTLTAVYVFLIPMAIYGLGWYYVFLYRSLISTYYAGILPFIVIALCVLKYVVMTYISDRWRSRLLILLVAGSVLFLLTNNMYLVYRNNAHAVFKTH